MAATSVCAAEAFSASYLLLRSSYQRFWCTRILVYDGREWRVFALNLQLSSRKSRLQVLVFSQTFSLASLFLNGHAADIPTSRLCCAILPDPLTSGLSAGFAWQRHRRASTPALRQRPCPGITPGSPLHACFFAAKLAIIQRTCKSLCDYPKTRLFLLLLF